MIKWENSCNTCWLLGNSVANTDFIRSVFDYDIRQRRALRGYPNAKFGLVVDYAEMICFKKFWYRLNFGTDRFLTDMPIFGDKSKDKIVRFINGYNITDIDGVHYRIEGTVEILKTKLDDKIKNLHCPLVPSTSLVIGAPLVPCGTSH